MKCWNCGNELHSDSIYCSSCGVKLSGQDSNSIIDEKGKRKKHYARLIGVLVVVLVVVAVAVAGLKVWQSLKSNTEKQLVYCKNGILYYIRNMDKGNRSLEVYNSHDDDAEFYAKLSKDQKDLFFQNYNDESNRLYYIETEKISLNYNKNQNNIKEIDSQVIDFKTIGSGRLLYYRYNDLYYYDGNQRTEIDKAVKKQYYSGDVVYYIKENGNSYKKKLFYYNLKNKKRGELGDCAEIIDYNEQGIIYYKSAERVNVNSEESYLLHDVYVYKTNSNPTKIVSNVYSVVGDIESGNLIYTKLREEKCSYYEYVDDSYQNENNSISEPDIKDYLKSANPEEILEGEEYEDYYSYRDYFYQFDAYYDEEWDMYKYIYEDYTYLINYNTDQWYYFNQESYEYAVQEYRNVGIRNELRNELKNNTKNEAFFDLYSYDEKSGEKKIAESIDYQGISIKNHIYLYSKADEQRVKKVCSIDDLSCVDDLEKYLYYTERNYDNIYIYIDGKEHKVEENAGNFRCSEDGKTIILETNNDGVHDLVVYKKKADGLEKIDTIANIYDYGYGFLSENKFYYYTNDFDFYVYSDGITQKIASNVYNVEKHKDGQYTGIDKDYSLKIFDEDEEKDTIHEVGYHYAYINKNHIVYLKDGCLYLYNGKDSSVIDSEVTRFWCRDALKGKS